MRFTSLFSALCLVASGVSAAAPHFSPEVIETAVGITKGDCYGAPIAPWLPDTYPGWYYGDPSKAPLGLACLVEGVDDLLCLLLGLLGLDLCLPWSPPTATTTTRPTATTTTLTVTKTELTVTTTTLPAVTTTTPPPVSSQTPPPPPPGYSYGYYDLNCATEEWPPQDYITYGIVDGLQSCATMCSNILDCVFANCYHDNNASKNTTLFTCAMFTVVTSIANATNCGNQNQGTGALTSISDSTAIINLQRTGGH
ncbi:hypothetical protein K438DRAFT_1995720 [Mycena galopus ATCC 62051]|nr:hypothetical protein K438DRAFT_1995720 [Mycena galopus ATCC 62051]